MIRVASNLLDSPPSTGPGNFGRRLAKALNDYGILVLPESSIDVADVYLASAFFNSHYVKRAKMRRIPSIIRLDGAGVGEDINRVEESHKLADICIYQSEYSKNLLQNKHSFIPSKHTVIHNGIYLPDLYQKIISNFDFISICNTWNEYRFPNFIEAIYKNMPTIIKEFPNFAWTIVGKQKDKDRYIQNTFNDKIRFVEFTDNLSDLRKNCYACIHLVQDDSCPNSLIESMAHGLPSIVWKESAGPEIVGNEVGGVVLNSFDEHEVIKAIHNIKDNYRFYSGQSRVRAETMFDIDVIAGKYYELISNP